MPSIVEIDEYLRNDPFQKRNEFECDQGAKGGEGQGELEAGGPSL